MPQPSSAPSPPRSNMGSVNLLGSTWEVLKNAPTRTTYCSEKNCFAHATKHAPEDHKPYCDVHVSDHMKEPKKEEQAKKVGVK